METEAPKCTNKQSFVASMANKEKISHSLSALFSQQKVDLSW